MVSFHIVNLDLLRYKPVVFNNFQNILPAGSRLLYEILHFNVYMIFYYGLDSLLFLLKLFFFNLLLVLLFNTDHIFYSLEETSHNSFLFLYLRLYVYLLFLTLIETTAKNWALSTKCSWFNELLSVNYNFWKFILILIMIFWFII